MRVRTPDNAFIILDEAQNYAAVYENVSDRIGIFVSKELWEIPLRKIFRPVQIRP